MKKVYISILLLILPFLFTACDDSGGGDGEGGTVTIVLTSDDIVVVDDEVLTAVFTVGGDPAADTPIAVGNGTIPASGSGLTVSFVLEATDASGDSTGLKWNAEKDQAYDLYIFIDINDNGDLDANTDISTAGYFPYQYSSINSDVSLSILTSAINDEIVGDGAGSI